MKIKVDHLTSKEFSEYADSTFAKPVKMSLGIFLGIPESFSESLSFC